MRRTPLLGPDLVAAGLDRFVFVVARLVGQHAGAIDEHAGLGRLVLVVVVVASRRVGLPDLDDRAGQRLARVDGPDPAANHHELAWLQGWRNLGAKRRELAMVGTEDVVLGRL